MSHVECTALVLKDRPSARGFSWRRPNSRISACNVGDLNVRNDHAPALVGDILVRRLHGDKSVDCRRADCLTGRRCQGKIWYLLRTRFLSALILRAADLALRG